jgi:hypothetical protein
MDVKDPRVLPDMAIKVTFLENAAPAAAPSAPSSASESNTNVIAK